MNLLRHATELALHEIVRFDPSPKAEIFLALLFTQPPDLDQIGHHI
jgi:hypothetical protein